MVAEREGGEGGGGLWSRQVVGQVEERGYELIDRQQSTVDKQKTPLSLLLVHGW